MIKCGGKKNRLYILLELLAGLSHAFKFFLNFNAGIVIRLQELLAELIKCLESPCASIDLSTMFLKK